MSLTEKPTVPSFWQKHKENLLTLLIAGLMALLIRGFVAESRYIPSESMEPTLHPGDRIMVEKVSYRMHPPRAGDIVVFRPPAALQAVGYGADQAFIKRVIALPGQTVAVHQGRVYVDRQPLSEPYLAAAPDYEMAPVQVPPDMLWVMGDNRNNSNDSHIWGFLPQSQVIGRANLRFWPLESAGILEAPQLAAASMAQ